VTASSFDVTDPTYYQNSATRICLVRVRVYVDCSWAWIHCVMINRVCFSPQPRTVRNVYNEVGTNPSGTGTSSRDCLDSLCKQVCAASRSGCPSSDTVSTGNSAN